MAEWTAATGALPPVFRTEVFDALEAVEQGTLTLVWRSGAHGPRDALSLPAARLERPPSAD